MVSPFQQLSGCVWRTRPSVRGRVNVHLHVCACSCEGRAVLSDGQEWAVVEGAWLGIQRLGPLPLAQMRPMIWAIFLFVPVSHLFPHLPRLGPATYLVPFQHGQSLGLRRGDHSDQAWSGGSPDPVPLAVGVYSLILLTQRGAGWGPSVARLHTHLSTCSHCPLPQGCSIWLHPLPHSLSLSHTLEHALWDRSHHSFFNQGHLCEEAFLILTLGRTP